MVEDLYSDTKSTPVSVFEQRFRQFLRNSDDYERRQVADREEEVDYLRNLEIEGLSLIHSLKKDIKKTPPNHEIKKTKIVKVFNIKVSSQSMKKRKLKCPHCPKSYNSVTLKPLQLHIRQLHKGLRQITSKDVQEEEEKVTCPLLKPNGNICGKKTTCDMMVRHVLSKKLHKTPQIAPEGKEFYGFRTSVESEPEPAVVWLSPNEDEPPEEEDFELSDTVALPDTINPREESGDVSGEDLTAHPQEDEEIIERESISI